MPEQGQGAYEEVTEVAEKKISPRAPAAKAPKAASKAAATRVTKKRTHKRTHKKH